MKAEELFGKYCTVESDHLDMDYAVMNKTQFISAITEATQSQQQEIESLKVELEDERKRIQLHREVLGELEAEIYHIREGEQNILFDFCRWLEVKTAVTISDSWDNYIKRYFADTLVGEKKMNRTYIFERISRELDRAYAKHGKAEWSRHEFYGIMTEEYIETQKEIFKGGEVPFDEIAMEKEIIQLASMCVRFLETKTERDAFGVPYNKDDTLITPKKGE